MQKIRYKKNLFGHILNNYAKGDKTPYAIVRDDGHREYPEDPGLYFKAGRPSIEGKGIRYASGRILDVGCGAGRYALAFQKKGLDVVGIDTDALCIQTSKERGVKKALKEDIFHPNKLRKLRFDTVWLAGNNLGIAGTMKKLTRLFAILDSLTSPDGVVLATGIEFQKTDSPEHISYHKRQIKRGHYPGEMKLRLEYKQHQSDWFPWLHIASHDLKTTLKHSVWHIEKLLPS